MDMITSVAYSPANLTHFLRYYSRLGYDRFLIGVHDKPDSEVGRAVLKAAEVCNIIPTFLYTDHFIYDYDIIFRRSARAFVVGEKWEGEAWAGIADLDEFHVYPQASGEGANGPMMTAQELISDIIRAGCNCAKGRLIDRVSEDGSLPLVSLGTNLEELFPVSMPFTEQIITREIRKLMIFRCDLFPSGGHHYADNEKPLIDDLAVNHFKWNSEALGHCEYMRNSLRADGKTWDMNYTNFMRHWRQFGKICLDPL